MSVIYFIFTFFLIVAVHEWGHFQTARSLKIAIDGFSIGMGPKLLAWKSKRTGIEYKISALPLGGFVAFTTRDANENALRDSSLEIFDESARWKRSLVVLAGPMMNFVFAFGLLLFVAMAGHQVIVPSVIGVKADSRAEHAGMRAGDTILEVEGHRIDSTSEFMSHILSQVGNDSVDLTVDRKGDTQRIEMNMSGITLSRESIDESISLMGVLFPSAISMRVESLSEGYPAAIAGIEVGDEVESINGKNVYYASEFIAELNQGKNRVHVIVVNRNGRLISFNVEPNFNQEVGRQVIGIRFGLRDDLDELFVNKPMPLNQAFDKALSQTWSYATMSYKFLEKLFTQDIAFNMISGPVGIAKATERAASVGVVTLFSFIALLSVNIGVINLLPIPGLDGGHLTIYAIEGTLRRELNRKAKEWALRVSVLLIILVMISAIYIDFLYN